MTAKNLDEAFKEMSQNDEYWLEQARIEFTEELVRIMNERNVSQSDLASRLGSTRPYVNRVIHGHENLTIASIVKIAKALRKRINFYFSEPNAAISVQEYKHQISDGSDIITFPIQNTTKVRASNVRTGSVGSGEQPVTSPLVR